MALVLSWGAGAREAEHAADIDRLQRKAVRDQRIEDAVDRDPIGFGQLVLDLGVAQRLGRGEQRTEHTDAGHRYLEARCAQQRDEVGHWWHAAAGRPQMQLGCIGSGGRYSPAVTSLPLLVQITLACIAGGLLSLLAAALVLFGLPKKGLQYAVSFSIGVLLATSMLHLLPEALEMGLTPHQAFPVLLAGILGFFALEKIAIWRHAHGLDDHAGGGDCEDHTHDHHHGNGGEAVAILVGDAFHNFTDGLLIAAAFLADPMLGWAATLAVVAHEVPQEAGDFAILLTAGWRRARALFWNGISSLASLAGGIVGYLSLERTQGMVPYIVTIAAASFTYIAIADLMPRLKREQKGIGWHVLLLLAGIAVVAFGGGHSH